MTFKHSFLALMAMLMLSATSDTQDTEEVNWEKIGPVLNEPEKLIMIDLYTDWCGWCKRMDATTYKDPAVVSYLNEHFHSVKFDAEHKEEVTLNGEVYKFVNEGRRGYHELAAALLNGRMSYPTVVFLKEDLSVISRVPGYQSARDFEMMIRYIGDGSYENTTWEAYKENFKTDKTK